MTSQLSNSFFGNKKLTQQIYNKVFAKQENTNKKINPQQLSQIFKPYTKKLELITTSQGFSLVQLFIEFMQSVSQRFIKWDFQKYSSVMEITAHVFEYSFEQWLTKQESYKYFSEVIVRHSLFRPPHSVCVFEYGEMKEVIQFWVEHFLRFYQQFEECFKSNLNEKIACVSFPKKIEKQQDLSKGKLVGKQAIANLL